MKRVTADTNIYMSALIWRGKPLRLLEQALQGEIDLAISPAIVSETLRVFRDKFDMQPDDLSKGEGFMRRCARPVEPTETLNVVAAHPSDDRIIECAVATRSEVLVTRDKHLLRLGEFRGSKIVNVSDCLAGGRSR